MNDMVPSLISSLGMPNIIIPKPFVLSDPENKDGLDKIKQEIVEKANQWENKMSTFFGEYEEYISSWRIQSLKSGNRPKALFNSVAGETHRATETQATFWFNQMTSADPFYYVQGMGLDDFGREVSEVELQAVEETLRKQLQYIKFSEKLLRGLRSLSLFGTMIMECPWTSFPFGDGYKSFEGTDMVLRPLLTTGFNPFVYDLDQSDYIFTIDYPTLRMLKNWSRNNTKEWDAAAVQKIVTEHKGAMSGSSTRTSVYNRVIQRKLRAGYQLIDSDVNELCTHHGRIDTENDVVMKYWESEGRKDDPSLCDFTVGTLHEQGVVRFHVTPFGTWHHLFKIAHSKLLEMEPLGYGVGRIGRKRQKEANALESRMNDLIMFNVLPMWKIGKYAGVDVSKLTIKPWNFVELENIDQLEPIKANIEALPYALNMKGAFQEDFRASNQATNKLQGSVSEGSATQSAIIQNESARFGNVISKIIADSFLREMLQTMHINNVTFMDQGFWVKVMGYSKPFYVNKDNLPSNVGMYMKLTTDHDSRPEMIKSLLEGLQIGTSVRNDPPPQVAMRLVPDLVEKLYRCLGLDVRKLQTPISPIDAMLYQLQKNQKNGIAPGGNTGQNPGQQRQTEMMGEGAGGGGAGGNNVRTPMGQISGSNVSMPSGSL